VEKGLATGETKDAIQTSSVIVIVSHGGAKPVQVKLKSIKLSL
jgi:hypothetical protein